MTKMAILLKEECVKLWEKSGKNEFLQICKSFLHRTNSKVTCDLFGRQSSDLKKAVYELCWYGVRGQLKTDQVAHAISDIVDLYPDAPLLVADLFGVIDIELSCLEEVDSRDRFLSITNACQNVVPDCLLKERLDPEALENLNLIQSKAVYQQKYVKTKTKLYYKQQKFNLLREESEGYSKLITELNQDFTDQSTPTAVLQNIKSLIGCFNLDPNRVLDIILETFECHPEMSKMFVPLLQEYALDRETLCHVLGFKFHFYQQTQDSVTPASLYHLAATLLQHRLVALDVLFAHLAPSNAEIIDKYKREMTEAKQYNHKLNIVNLSDKPAVPEVKEPDEKDKNENFEPSLHLCHILRRADTEFTSNQKFGLCEALIKIGSWEHAKSIMNSMPPFSAISYKPLAECLCRLIHYVVEPVYVENSGLPSVLIKKRRIVNFKASSTIVQAKTFDDLPELVFPLLRQLGPHLVCDPVLLVKINRLARTYMLKNEKVDETSEVFGGFLTVYDEVILPSMSLMPGNCCLSEEIWGFVKLLRYEHRYRLYGQWKNESRLHHSALIRAHADILSKAKYIMKRLAKENVKPLGRQIGKLSHSAPGVVFEYILSQIQRYDNFIGPVVDSLKFLTSLSYDVLAYCVIEALANPERERLKTDGTNISAWLQSLANFSGSVLKKYQIDIAGLLHYIANQLKADKSYDLYILREVIQKMAGIEVSEEITTDQLMAMGGGELLRQEGGYFTQVRNTKKASSRLMDSLLEHELAIPVCLMMAQQRNGIIFQQQAENETDRRHIKLVGKLYDQCQDTLVQFISFLSLQLTTDELKKRLPNVLELAVNHNTPPDVAFALWRAIYSNEISSKTDELRKNDKKDKSASSTTQNVKVQRYYEAVEFVMQPIREQLIEPIFPPKMWEELNLQFYTTFWSLGLYDLDIPTQSYEKQLATHQAQLAAIDDNKELAQSKKKKEKERCTALMEKLSEEEKKQEEHVKLVMARLKQERDLWFSTRLAKHSTITAILQFCLFPRCCFTAIDAIYCAKFLYILHNLKTPNFSSLICYDRIFSDITWSLTSCTENEAHRYGRFLCAVLDDIMRWHGDRGVYEKECANYPGFVTVFRSPSTTQNVTADHLDYENYRHVVHKWHYSLTRVSVNCLESGDYIQIRNLLVVLTKILPNYPKVLKLGTALERRVERVIELEKEKRQDLYVLALAYSGQLKSTKKTWVADHQFHKKEPEIKAQVAKPNGGTNPADQTTAVASGTPAEKREKAETNEEIKPITDKSQPEKSPTKANSKARQKESVPAMEERIPTATVSSGSIKSENSSKTRMAKPKEVKNGSDWMEKERRVNEAIERSDIKKDVVDREREKSSSSREEKRNAEWRVETEDKLSKEKDRGVSRKSSDRGEAKGGTRGHSLELERDYDQQEEMSHSNEGQSVHSEHRMPRPAEDRDVKRRKIEAASGSKESHSESREKLKKSPPSFERIEERERRNVAREGKDGDWEKKRDASRSDKQERKRLSGVLMESEREELNEVREPKRHKTEDSAMNRESLGKLNGSEVYEKKKESQSARSKERLPTKEEVLIKMEEKNRARDDEEKVRIKGEELAKERFRMKEEDFGKQMVSGERGRMKDEDGMKEKDRLRDRESANHVRKKTSLPKESVDKEKRLSSDKHMKKSSKNR